MSQWVHRSLAVLLTLALVAPSEPAVAARGLQVQVTPQDVDIAKRTVYFRLNNPADSASLQVFGENGQLLGETSEIYNSAPAGTRLSIEWPVLPAGTENFRIELKFTDVNEFWVGMSICRFQGSVPHDEVVFESGKWEVRPQEAPKLDAAIPSILEMLDRSLSCSGNDRALYIAGYTDTVGSTADNRELSQRRARAIAQYFLANGLAKKKIAVYVRGFGEEVLRVKTADNTDEERNRRADYIVSNFQPEIAGPGAWVRLK